MSEPEEGSVLSSRFGHPSVNGGRLLTILGLGFFWGWLLTQWLNDWVLSRFGIGPGAGEHLLSREPFAMMATDVEAGATGSGLLAGVVDWVASVIAGVGVVVDIAPALASGAWYTIVLTVVAMGLGLVIAVPLAVVRVYGGPFRWGALGFIELIRGTPLLVQLFVLYYGLPLAVWLHGIDVIGHGPLPDQAFWIAIIGFTINSAAYQAEYIRGAIEGVDAGQLTAARAVGLSKIAGIRRVVLPQTMRYAIPAWTNELVYLIKYSSLAAFITVPELYYRADRIASQTFEYTPIFAAIALVYLGIVLSTTLLMNRVEAALAIPGIGQVQGRQQGSTVEN